MSMRWLITLAIVVMWECKLYLSLLSNRYSFMYGSLFNYTMGGGGPLEFPRSGEFRARVRFYGAMAGYSISARYYIMEISGLSIALLIRNIRRCAIVIRRCSRCFRYAITTAVVSIRYRLYAPRNARRIIYRLRNDWGGNRVRPFEARRKYVK